MRMPSKKQYNLVINDELDSRIPLHPDEAFTSGIKFSAKYIGTLDVPRPTSKIEIVAAMRRIRYEFKAKAIKKKKVSMEVSVDGVRVLLRKKKKKAVPPVGSAEEARLLVMSHPIYRIFYVSHDSQDLKIFSYIARDASSNVFRCSVFKASKKSQAMRIVRTVGQAFEVCHKYSAVKEASPCPDSPSPSDRHQDSDDSADTRKKDLHDGESSQEDQMTLTSDDPCDDSLASGRAARPLPADPHTGSPSGHKRQSSIGKGGDTFSSPLDGSLYPALGGGSAGTYTTSAGTSLSLHHELQLVREQLEQQQQQTQAAVAQVHLLRDQLAAETAARLEAQARTHQLLVHNKELLEHIQALVLQIRELEITVPSSPSLPPPPTLHSAPDSSTNPSTSTAPPTPSIQNLDDL